MINMLGLFLLASHCAVVVAVGYRTTVGSAWRVSRQPGPVLSATSRPDWKIRLRRSVWLRWSATGSLYARLSSRGPLVPPGFPELKLVREKRERREGGEKEKRGRERDEEGGRYYFKIQFCQVWLWAPCSGHLRQPCLAIELMGRRKRGEREVGILFLLTVQTSWCTGPERRPTTWWSTSQAAGTASVSTTRRSYWLL